MTAKLAKSNSIVQHAASAMITFIANVHLQAEAGCSLAVSCTTAVANMQDAQLLQLHSRI